MLGRERFATMYSHPHRPRPGRRRQQLAPRPLALIPVLLILITLLSTTFAHEIEIPYQEYTRSTLFKRLERRGEIAIDRRDPPVPPAVRRRQDNGDPFGSTPAPLATPTSGSVASASASSSKIDSTNTIDSKLTVTPTKTLTRSASSTATGGGSTSNSTTSIETAPSSTGAASPLPSPFDTSIGSNFTSKACPNFFDTFLNNSTFKDCHPTSLLLQNSNSFFKTSRSPVLLSQALDASCGASLAQCGPLMSSLASQLMQDSNCGQDYRNENPIVTQARAGLISYEPLYRATCLKNSATGNYCFADAITNTSNPSDSYPYYTALGTNLPAASRPTCNKCLQDTMGIFAGYAANKDQPVSKTYTSTAQQIDLGCGPSFVNATVPVATYSSGAAQQSSLTDASALLAFVVGLVVACMAF
jgi:hypothetical protein